MDTWRIYTDGSSTNYIGGWAFVLVFGDKIIHSQYGGERGLTNNRAELMAMIKALEFLPTKLDMISPKPVIIISDSQYVVHGYNDWSKKWMRNGWKKDGQDVKNKELWQQLIKAGDAVPTQDGRKCFEIFWQRGHADCPFNDHADYLAGKGAKEV